MRMTDALEILVGGLLVLMIFGDALMTTLAVSVGGGPLTRKVLGLCWRGMLRLHRRNARSSLLNTGGAVLLIMTVLVWVAGLLLGWTLVFLGSDVVVSATTRQSAGATDVAYFSGLTVFTLGTGDFVATSAFWRLVSALASFSGLFLVTLAITYLISVVSAVVMRRSLAIQISGLGPSAQDMVLRGWNGTGFSVTFEQQLVTLTPYVVTAAEQHLAYPVLHYFHSSQPSLAAPVALARMEDAMLMLDVVTPGRQPDTNAVAPLRFAMERYVHTATKIAWVPQVPAPEAPCLAPLRRAGIPLVSDEKVAAALDESADRRTQLNRLVVSDGWSWTAGSRPQ